MKSRGQGEKDRSQALHCSNYTAPRAVEQMASQGSCITTALSVNMRLGKQDKRAVL